MRFETMQMPILQTVNGPLQRSKPGGVWLPTLPTVITSPGREKRPPSF